MRYPNSTTRKMYGEKGTRLIEKRRLLQLLHDRAKRAEIIGPPSGKPRTLMGRLWVWIIKLFK